MNVCLGVHECDLCPADEAPEGNGEVRIPGGRGIAYVAPFLITHYVTAHGYRPPQAFMDAVLAVDLDAWASARWPDVPFPWVPDDAERMLPEMDRGDGDRPVEDVGPWRLMTSAGDQRASHSCGTPTPCPGRREKPGPTRAISSSEDGSDQASPRLLGDQLTFLARRCRMM